MPDRNKTNSITKKRILISRIKRKILSHIWLARVGLIFLVLAGIVTAVFLTNKAFGAFGIPQASRVIANFLFVPKDKVKSTDGKVNILILGKAGEEYAGGDLTDTMIFASVSLDRPKATLISIPRDIWIAQIRAKINSAYYWGNQKKERGGFTLAKSTVEDIVGVPIHYGLVIDFSGFKKIVDILGGIEVKVSNSFVDEKYPIAGREDDLCGGDPEFRCRYETLRFTEGKQMMNGETALKFVRSRNAEGEEGTDIAREKRQQLVISAIRNKILSPSVFLSPKKTFNLWKAFRESMETDISSEEAAVILRKILSARSKIKSHLIPEELLEHPPVSPKYDNQYVFISKSGNWEEIHAWVSSILN